MVTFLIAFAVVVACAVLVAHGTGRAGSSDVVDRDAQRMQAELIAMRGRDSHHR